MELSQEPQISSDPNTKGFDLSAGNNWIYPLNYQFREYQHNIAKNALFSNTLVCLPTGLGKTLIAAVVMYNFWRWYPRGKIVFLAPTKPLVAQQISACHDIMGIPSADTIELTGAMNPKNRQVAWFTKRVIFATPQVFQNDLEKDILSGELVRCVVIDEAHKALGKHSYCESLRLLQMRNTCFRVLALSATPGSKLEDVCQVMKNLLISNLELRDETSPDIIPYLNKRQMDIILVPLDKDLARFKEKYVSIMDRHVRLLVQYNVLKGDASTISKGRIFYVYKDFQSKTNKPGNYGQIMKTISRCISLYHAYELLIRHGLRAFATFCQSHSTDNWMTDEPALQNLIEEILKFLGPFPDVRPLPDGSVDEVPEDVVFGHTKFHKLKSLLVEHFQKFAAKNEETRAIVFVEYRDSVNEVYVSLLQLRPTLRPKMFVGQAGQKRKQQMQAMEAFRNNEANVLISTSVGEEGLDVGEVDLIVCFDISQSSPIRLVQRMGRTGRRRDGRIVMLVTDGKEHQALKSTIARRDSLNKKVLYSSNVVSALYQESPRMVPPDLNPVCSKMHIVLQPKTPAGKGKRKRKDNEDDPQRETKKRATGLKNHAANHVSEENQDLPLKENKKKNTGAKSTAALLGEVERAKPGQSSMLKFLKKPSTSKEPDEVSTLVSQTSQSSRAPSSQITQSTSIKLFACDAVALEFLTLCAIKVSKFDEARNDFNKMDKTYLTISPHDDTVNFFDYPVPDLSILNCIGSLEPRTESDSPEFVEDFGFDQIDNDLYLPDHNELDIVEYRETNNSPAVGKFNYEDLFADSSESNEVAVLNDPLEKRLHDNFKVFPDKEESRQSQINDQSKRVKKMLTQNDGDEFNAALIEDIYPDEPSIAERLLDQVSEAHERRFEEENNLLKIGCFESILDESSDSDIPSSQGEIDLRRSMKLRGSSTANYAVSEKQNAVEIEKSTNYPSTSSARNAVFSNQNKICPMMPAVSKYLNNNSRGAESEATSSLTSSEINKRMDVNRTVDCNDGRNLCLPRALDQSAIVSTSTDTGSRFFASKRKERSEIGIGLNSKIEGNNTVVNQAQTIIDETRLSNENINKCFGETLEQDDDDDVIFVGEVNQTVRADNNVEKSINDVLGDDDDEVVFEKEVSFAEKKKANESNADSSECTITQILELIENSTSRKVNLSKISKKSQSLSDPRKIKLDNVSTPDRSVKTVLLHDKTVPKAEINSPDASTSYYFSNKNRVSKNLDVSLKTDEPPVDDLDLSDIKWEDEFIDDEHADSSKVGEKINSDSRQSKTNNWKTRLLNEKEDSFKTNSGGSEVCLENKIDIQKPITHQLKTSQLNEKEASFQTTSDSSGLFLESKMQQEKPTTDRPKTSLLNKKEESFKTNSDSSGLFLESKMQTEKSNEKEESFRANLKPEKSSPFKTADFDLGDYEWDSDFETPANPVASWKQFGNSNNTSSPNKLEAASVSRPASKKLSLKSKQPTGLSSCLAQTKKKLGIQRSETVKPSTSRDYFDDDDSDFEEVFFRKFDGKFKSGKDRDPNVNYLLSTNRSPMISKELKVLQREKENAEPNSGVIKLSSFSADRKNGDIKKLSSSRGAAISDRKKYGSLNGDSHKKKKDQCRNRVKSAFLDQEAEIYSDTSSGTSGEDDDLEGFVSHTQHVPETDDMHGHYLQSIKDVHKIDAFHFREPKCFVPDDEVFSQPLSQVEESAYVYDSFCVSGGEDDVFAETHEDSILELTERLLNSKKRKHSKNGKASVAKKRKVAERLSDTISSEDETEELRKQILDESMNLKRNKN